MLCDSLRQFLEGVQHRLSEQLVDALEVAEKGGIADIGMCRHCSDGEVLVALFQRQRDERVSQRLAGTFSARGSMVSMLVLSVTYNSILVNQFVGLWFCK